MGKSAMKKQYGLYSEKNGRHVVEANFRGKSIEIVFEGLSHKECVAWCHTNNMRMMEKRRFSDIVQESFRKVNAKTKYNPNDYQIAVVY